MAVDSQTLDFSRPIGPGMPTSGRRNSVQQNLNLDLQTYRGDRPIRANSRTTTETSGSLIGFQCKPGGGGGASATASVKGAEFSPRVADGTAGADLIGGSFDPILQGSSGSGGNLSGAVRALELTITDGNGGTRTITGKSAALYIFMQLTTKTFTNGLFCIQVPAAGAGSWTSFLDLPNGSGVAAATDAGENIPAGVTEYFYVNVGGTRYRCPLYHVTN